MLGHPTEGVCVVVDLDPAILLIVAAERATELIAVADDHPYARHHVEDQRVLDHCRQDEPYVVAGVFLQVATEGKN